MKWEEIATPRLNDFTQDDNSCHEVLTDSESTPIYDGEMIVFHGCLQTNENLSESKDSFLSEV
jgi:hypothetical protein